jgi:hypothetical protein
MKLWVMRIVGGLNLALGFGGIAYSAVMLSERWRMLPGGPSMSAWIVFLSLLGASILLVGCLIYLGIRLLCRDEAAIGRTAVLFGAEMFYFLAYVVLFWIVIPLKNAQWPGLAGHLFGMIQGPLTPQIVTGYPVLGLLAMVLIRRRDQPPV